MMPTMTMFDVLHREIVQAQERAVEVVQIRVSADAIPGSATTTMIAPERLRLLAAQQREFLHSEGGLTADPEKQERWREIVMHPEDWRDVLTDPAVRQFGGGVPTAIFGIPVVHTPPSVGEKQ